MGKGSSKLAKKSTITKKQKLTGSDKQIAWAEDILDAARVNLKLARSYWADKRQKEIAVQKIRIQKGKKDYSLKNKQKYDQLVSAMNKLEKYINTVTSAKEVIDRRNEIVVGKDDRYAILKFAGMDPFAFTRRS